MHMMFTFFSVAEEVSADSWPISISSNVKSRYVESVLALVSNFSNSAARTPTPAERDPC